MFLRLVAVLLFGAFLALRPVGASAGENGVVDFLPIFGSEMTKMGMTPPKPFFISPMFFYMEDYLKITDASGSVPGINDQLPVTMSNASTVTSSGGIRAGFWLFPFLQIFGMYLYNDGYTKFNAKMDENTLPEILPNGYNLNQKIKFSAQTGAIGINAAYGFKLGHVYPFGSLNANYAWTNASLVDKILSTVVFSARVGLNVPTPVPNMDVSFWVGAMYKLTLGLSEQVSGRYTVTVPEINGGRPFESSYSATQKYVSPWNMVAGATFNPCRYFGIMTEFGFIGKFTANVGLNFNF